MIDADQVNQNYSDIIGGLSNGTKDIMVANCDCTGTLQLGSAGSVTLSETYTHDCLITSGNEIQLFAAGSAQEVTVGGNITTDGTSTANRAYGKMIGTNARASLSYASGTLTGSGTDCTAIPSQSFHIIPDGSRIVAWDLKNSAAGNIFVFTASSTTTGYLKSSSLVNIGADMTLASTATDIKSVTMIQVGTTQLFRLASNAT